MIDFLSLSKDGFGLEITDTFVRVIKFARRAGKTVAVSAGLALVVPGAVKDGDVKDENGLVDAIKKAVSGSFGEKIKTKRVVVSLPENKSFLQVIKMPKLQGEDLRAAVVFEAENYIPLPLEKVYLDYEIVPPVSSRVDDSACEVLIAAFPREVVDARLQAIVKAGFIPVAMELESQAASRAILAGKTSQPPMVIFQIGDDRTNLIIYSENSIRLTFSIPISNLFFLETISRSAQVGMEEADVLKRECGIKEFTRMSDSAKADDFSNLPQLDSEKRKIFEALVPGLVDLVQQTKKCLQYYQTHGTGCDANQIPIEKILLCGSGSDLLGLDDFIALKLNMRVEHVSPPVCMKAVEGILPRQNLCGYAVASGLAMRALNWDLPKFFVSDVPTAATSRIAGLKGGNAAGSGSAKKNMSKSRRIKIES